MKTIFEQVRRATAVFGLLLISISQAVGAAPPVDDLQRFTDQLAWSFIHDPKQFQALVGGPTPFDQDEVSAQDRQISPPKILVRDDRGGTAIILVGAGITPAAAANSGDRTSYSASWSGLYEARRSTNGWRLEKRLPIALNNRLLAHDIDLRIDPKTGLTVVDTMSVNVASPYGFTSVFNSDAQVTKLTVDGRSRPFAHDQGILWVDSRPGKQRISIHYRLPMKDGEIGNSSGWNQHAGHVRNQFYWHPFFGFGQPNSLASFHVKASIDARYRLALDLPQSDKVAKGQRITEGQTPFPSPALSFAFDDSWDPTHFDVAGMRLNLFATRDFKPSADELRPYFEHTVESLQRRFGKPPVTDTKIVQARLRDGEGWHFLSNQAIFAGKNAGRMVRVTDFLPMREYLGHEISHLWTHPSGPATNLFMEGWATYAESLLIQDSFGTDAEHQFWEDQARLYANSDSAKSTALSADPSNSGVSYSKGSWLLHMIEQMVGASKFDVAIRAFSALPHDQATYQGFLAGFGERKADVERFSKPWYEEIGLPNLKVGQEGGALFVRQPAPFYWLPKVDVRLIDSGGRSVISTIDVDGPRTAIPTHDLDDIQSIEIDPFHHLLLAQRFFTLKD